MKKVYILLMVAALTTGAMAQSKSGRGGNFDPSARAQQMTEHMATELSLTDAQKTKVLELNKSQMESRSAAMKASDDERAQKMEAMRTEYDAKLKKILTTEQYKTYTTNQANRQGRGGRGNGSSNNKTKSSKSSK
jgi:Spy/CpxP family protein refolding chaperone